MRKSWAIILNILAPGAGLILLRREWLGLLLAVLFSMLSVVGLWGLLLVPLAVPPWMVGGSLAGAGLLWVWSQWLLYARSKVAFSPGVKAELADLCHRADRAVERGDFQAARQTLLVALALNDEDVEVNVRWARVAALTGPFREARKAWLRVLQLDRDDAHRREAVAALQQLPSE